jgi:hypothetical protein
MRSVSKKPGSRLLMVTLCATVFRASPATKPVRPERAPLDRPSTSIGIFTAPEVMFTMRPKRRAIMPSTVALISSMGASMLASSAASQSSRDPVAEIARRRAAGVVDQDVRLRAGRQRGGAAFRRHDVGGDPRHRRRPRR